MGQGVDSPVQYSVAVWNEPGNTQSFRSLPSRAIEDPIEHQARTLATLYKLEEDAAEKYIATESPNWWDRWLKAVLSTSKFLGLDAPTRMNAEVDAEEVSFTIEFETPGAPHKMDASLDIFELGDPSLMEGE